MKRPHPTDTWRPLVVLAAWAVGAPLDALSPVVLQDPQQEHIIGRHLEILNDAPADWTIADVSTVEPSRFVQGQEERPQFSEYISTLWLRFTVVNRSSVRDWVLRDFSPGNDRVDLYTPDGAGGWTVAESGGALAFVMRPLAHRQYAFRLDIEPGARRTYYVRVEGGHVVPLGLLSRERFLSDDHDAQIVLGMFYGLMAAMALYNLFVFFSLRDRAYLYYVLMIAFGSLVLALFNGIAQEYLWPHSEWGFLRTFLLFDGLMHVFTAKFVQAFLATRTTAPRLHRSFDGVVLVSVAIALSPLVDLHMPVFHSRIWVLLMLAVWAGSVLAGIAAWRRGFRPARFFLIAWGALIVAVLAILLAILDVLPFGFLTRHGAQIAFAALVVLMSLALADRINVLQREKQAQETELHTAHVLQMALMPQASPQVEGLQVSGRCLPASDVGGDFFQYFHGSGKLAVCLADVTGHAMEAAVPVMTFGGVLDTQMQTNLPLDELFSSLNRSMERLLGSRTFVCFVMGQLDVDAGVLQVINAGCPFPYRYETETAQVSEIELSAYPLGVRAESAYAGVDLPLRPGDYLVLCSDGIIEATDASDEDFGFERTSAAIHRACAGGLAAEDVVEQVLREVLAFSGDRPQADDMTCVVLRALPEETARGETA